MLGGLSFPTLLLHAPMGPGLYLVHIYSIHRPVQAAVATLPLIYSVLTVVGLSVSNFPGTLAL